MIVTTGEMLIEFVSHTTNCNLSTIGPYSGPYPSGAPAIFIDQAARVGAKTAIFGSVGADAFGRSLLKRLEDDGVDISHITIHEDKTTGTAFVSYFDSGERIFVFHLEGTAADALPPVTMSDEPAIFHISGASLGNKNVRQAVLEAIKNLGEKSRVSYDPNIRPELLKDTETRETIDAILAKTDIFLPSLSDIDALFPGQSPTQIIDHFLTQGASIVAVKRDKNGVIGSDGGELIELSGNRVDEIDPTGAGDCFCGTLVGLLDIGFSFEKALTYANAAGALHVTERGPMELNPTTQQIEAFLA